MFIKKGFTRSSSSERGSTVPEYSLLSAVLCVMLIVGVTAMGGKLNYYAFGQLSWAFRYGGGSSSSLPPPDGGGSDVTGARARQKHAVNSNTPAEQNSTYVAYQGRYQLPRTK